MYGNIAGALGWDGLEVDGDVHTHMSLMVEEGGRLGHGMALCNGIVSNSL
jgi:hypothetical protein